MDVKFKNFINDYTVNSKEELSREKKDKRVVLDEYIKNKIDCFNDKFSEILGERTKITYFRVLVKHVHKHELALKKDLSLFTAPEIETVIESVATNASSTKRGVFQSISHYMGWCVDRKIISFNPCSTMDITDALEINGKVVQSHYLPLYDFYKQIDTFEKSSDVEKLVFILIRYGVPASHVPDVRWEDLDRVNMVLNVNMKGKDIKLPIDEEFIRRVDMAYKCDKKGDNTDSSMTIKYIDSGYMIKSKKAGNITKTTVYTIIERASRDNGLPRPDLGVFVKNRRYDFVLEKHNNGEIIYSGFLKEVLNMLGITSSAPQLTAFKKELESVFGITVNMDNIKRTIQARKNGKLIVEFNSAQKVADALNARGFSISRMTVNNYLKSGLDYNGITFKYSWGSSNAKSRKSVTTKIIAFKDGAKIGEFNSKEEVANELKRQGFDIEPKKIKSLCDDGWDYKGYRFRYKEQD